MNHNPFNFKIGDKVILDKGYNNSSEVTIVSFTFHEMYATVQDEDLNEWEVMTYRLTPLNN